MRRILPVICALLLVSMVLAGLSLPGAQPEVRSSALTVSTGTVAYLRTVDTATVEKFSKPRSFWGKLLEWVAGPAQLPQLLRPYGVAEDSLGRLIVTDPSFGAVHVFDFERQRHDLLRRAKRERLRSPIGVVVDNENNIYVAASERARIYVFDPKGKFLRALSPHWEGEGLRRPTGLAIAPAQDLLYITDTLRHQVVVVTLQGDVVGAFGARGGGVGEFNFPTSLALSASGDELYVVDTMNFRVQVFTPQGEFMRSFGEQGEQSGTLFRPKGIALDSDGHVYLVDGLFEVVQVFGPEGELLYYFGSFGDPAGRFALPSGIYISPRDRIFVADSHNQRVQVFRYRQAAP
jgi:sugar lactone lactonase YvrE